MPWNKTDRSFKTLINKRTTDSDGKFFFNESGDFTLNVHQGELWVDPVPATAPGSSSDTVAVYDTLTLMEDISVPSKASWFATSNSDTASAQTDEASRLKDWVSDKYGAGYAVLLYDEDDVQIPPSDGCGWFFDYQTGILTFASTTTTTGPGGTLAARAGSGGFKIKGYRYTGRKGLDGNVIKNDVRLATPPGMSFSGWTYDDGDERIDTGVTSTTLDIDGVDLSSVLGPRADRILIKDWSTLSNNGIYYVERAGDGATDTWTLRRAPDFDSSEDIFAGLMVFVREGDTQARTVWSMVNPSFTTLDAGSSAGEIQFTQYVGGGSGTGTSATLPVWTSGGVLTDSVIFQNAANNDASQVTVAPATVANSVLLSLGNVHASAIARIALNADNVAGSTSAGLLNLPASTNSARGIAFGTDVFYRSNPSAGNGLRSSIGLVADTILAAALSGGTHQFRVSSSGSVTIEPQSTGEANNLTIQNFDTDDDDAVTAVVRMRIRKSDDTVNLFEVDSAGTLRAVVKEFVIPHPALPGHHLAHGCLEGPENGAYFRGTAAGRGRVRVQTPDYWAQLVGSDYTVAISPRTPGSLYVCERGEGGFTVTCRGLFSRWRKVEFDWVAIGSRTDAPLKVVRPVQT